MADQQQTTRIETEVAAEKKLCPSCNAANCQHLQEKTHPTLVNLPKLSAQVDPMLEGAEFSGSYEVLGRIGEGGMSVVFKARHRILNRIVAIKMLHSNLIRDSLQIKRFQQEAQALFSLEHPNIVAVREFGLTNAGVPYLIMDFLEGKSLSELIASEGPLPADRALRIFLQACAALQHAHSKGIVHRDIKPSNLVVTKDEKGDDEVKIVDFGIAKLTQENGDVNPALTQTGDVFGSPLYMSPEQCLGHKLDARTDIYALGCVMYETLSGKPPLMAETALATIHKHTTEMPDPIEIPNCDPRLRARFDEIIFKALEKEPGKRYQEMKELAAALKEVNEYAVFKPGAGAYISYARWYHRLMKRWKQHPIRFTAAILSLFTVLVVIPQLCISLISPMYGSVTPVATDFAWRWNVVDFVLDSGDYETGSRKLQWFLRHELRSETDPRKRAYERQKAADWHFKRKRFPEAAKLLREAADDLRQANADASTQAELTTALGDACAAANAYDEAVRSYKRAIALYDSEQQLERPYLTTLLKRAAVEYRLRGYATALSDCALVHATALRMLESDVCEEDAAYAESIAGDCYLQIALEEKRDKLDNHNSLSHASREFHNAAMHWAQDTTDDLTADDRSYNVTLSDLGAADAFLLDKQPANAARIYERISKAQTQFTKNPSFRHNYAVALWQSGQPLRALLSFWLPDWKS